MARRRNSYRPGTESYARWRKAELRRRAALARATAERTKKPEVRQRANRRAAAAERGLREIASRQDYRSALNERDRDAFNHLSINQQNQLLRVLLDYSETVPSDLPDPFAGRNRSSLWRLYYSTRAGSRQRAAA
jgi:hypothetical protein